LAIITCACGKARNWGYDEIRSEKREFASNRLRYLKADPLRGIELEFIQTANATKAYLNLHSFHKTDRKDLLVTFEAGGQARSSSAYVLAGGQRVLLSEEIAEWLMQTLKEGHSVHVQLPGYRQVVDAAGFAHKLKRMQHPLPVGNPFRLPY